MTKNWFITGTSTGLGRILTVRLLARGDTVVATLRREGALDELKSRYGSTLQTLVLDLTDTQAVRDTTAKAFAHAGRIDVVVSNAGYGLFGAAEELEDDQIERQIATNLIGSVQLIRAVVPHLRTQGGGRIVQVSSEGGQVAYPNFSLYHATKWGIEGFIEAVRQEVAPFGIDFVIVEPGPTRTSFATGLAVADPLPNYENTPSGDMRRMLSEGQFELKGDPVKCVDAVISAADDAKPRLRLALGSTAYAHIKAALTERLDDLEAGKDVALAADVDPA